MYNQEEKAQLLANLYELLRQDALLAEAHTKLRGMILAAIDLLKDEEAAQHARVTAFSASSKPRASAPAASDVRI